VNLLLDMNISPRWADTLIAGGHHAVHWSTVGDPAAPDDELFKWASTHRFVVFTADLDFGDILAATSAQAPSVFQVRTQDLSPTTLGELVLDTLDAYREQLARGALITVDKHRARIRLLPIP
jgi:predicted nuclease of predicted toxin-antitoxin system